MTRQTPSPTASKAHVAIEPRSGWHFPNVGELLDFRELLLTLGIRDLKVRYKQTALGVAWVVLQPLIAAGLFSFVFGSVASMEAPGGVPYFLFSFAGLVAWNVFAGSIQKSTQSLISNAHLVSKVYFPRTILPLSTVFATLTDFLVTFVLLLGLALVYWSFPGAGLLLMPVPLVALAFLALGIGLAGSALAVRFRDVRYVVPVATQFLLWASPVAYAVSEVPEAYRSWYELNPLVPLLETFRWSVLGVGELDLSALGYGCVVSLAALLGGLVLFQRMEDDFADVI